VICQTCGFIIKHQYFENFILIIIIWNTIMLTLDDPTNNNSTYVTLLIDDIFLWTYFIECLLKILGLGFLFNEGAYLRDGWNILDFTIVSSSMLPIFLGSNTGFSLNSLRSLRVLRPLRTISTVKSLKVLLNTLFSSLPYLLNTLIILLFFFIIFAVGGLQLFMGVLKKRCFLPETGVAHEDDIICGYKECPSGYICGKMLKNPDFDITGFDDIGISLLMVFVCVTMEGWTQIMFYIVDAFSEGVIVYFVVMVFFGNFFLLNLTQAVIKAKFSEAGEKKVIAIKEEEEV